MNLVPNNKPSFVLSNFIEESKQYKSMVDIEKMLETSSELSSVPIWPLFYSIQQLEMDSIAEMLPRLSTRQRQLLLDIDNWTKDHSDLNRLEFWLMIYARCSDLKVIEKYVQTYDFKLFLKLRFHIQTFDLEEPEYPEHDNFFVTDDNQLLIEYDENFSGAKELQYLVRNLYATLGTDEAYNELIRLTTESSMVLQEECYQHKKERLRDIGYVDYYDALEMRSLRTKHHLDQYIKLKKNKKVIHQDGVANDHVNQVLHASITKAFNTEMELVFLEEQKVSSEKRREYLQFTFLRLINANMTLDESFHSSYMEINDVNTQTRNYLLLGLEYLTSLNGDNLSQNILDVFDFIDCYKIGFGLLQSEISEMKKRLEEYDFNDSNQKFLGDNWINFIDDLCLMQKILVDGKYIQIKSLATYEMVKTRLKLLNDLIPSVNKVFYQFQDLKESNKVSDYFYLNYKLDEVSFDVLFQTSVLKLVVHDIEDERMGLLVSDFKKFMKIFEKLMKNERNKLLKNEIEQIVINLGLDRVAGLVEYFQESIYNEFIDILSEEISDDEYKHVGGVLLLQS